MFHRTKSKEVNRLRRTNMVIFPKSATEEDGSDANSALDTVAGLTGAFDNMGQNDTGESTDSTEDTQSTTEVDTAEDENDPAESDNAQQDKSNRAFGQMRIQIKEQAKLLTKMADAMGIEYANQKDLMDKLNNNALEQLAQKQGVPKELLERLEQLEGIAAQSEEQRLHNNALAGFQELHDSFGLDDNALQAFAAELDEADKNPFVKDLDVVQLYKTMHFDDIVQAKVDAAVAAALSKDAQVSQHASTPTTGGTSESNTDGEKVSTVAGLTAMLNTITK